MAAVQRLAINTTATSYCTGVFLPRSSSRTWSRKYHYGKSFASTGWGAVPCKHYRRLQRAFGASCVVRFGDSTCVLGYVDVDMSTVLLIYLYSFLTPHVHDLVCLSGMICCFCHHLRWRRMEALLHQYEDRLNFGAQPEILNLLKVVSNATQRDWVDLGRSCSLAPLVKRTECHDTLKQNQLVCTHTISHHLSPSMMPRSTISRRQMRALCIAPAIGRCTTSCLPTPKIWSTC